MVDDSPTIARLQEINLRAAGYEVRLAGNGTEALRIAEACPPDIVLLDLMMPEMDGLELTRRLREDPRTAGVAIIMVTAKSMSTDKLASFEAGADDFLVKPFVPDDLLARVEAVSRARRH